MDKYIPWTTVEQLVLVESIDNYSHISTTDRWNLISECVVTTLKMISNIDQRRFTPDNCSREWTNIRRDLISPYPDRGDEIQFAINCLRRKRIEELDKEMFNIKSKLLRLKDIPPY